MAQVQAQPQAIRSQSKRIQRTENRENEHFIRDYVGLEINLNHKISLQPTNIINTSYFSGLWPENMQHLHLDNYYAFAPNET